MWLQAVWQGLSMVLFHSRGFSSYYVLRFDYMILVPILLLGPSSYGNTDFCPSHWLFGKLFHKVWALLRCLSFSVICTAALSHQIFELFFNREHASICWRIDELSDKAQAMEVLLWRIHTSSAIQKNSIIFSGVSGVYGNETTRSCSVVGAQVSYLTKLTQKKKQYCGCSKNWPDSQSTAAHIILFTWKCSIQLYDDLFSQQFPFIDAVAGYLILLKHCAIDSSTSCIFPPLVDSNSPFLMSLTWNLSYGNKDLFLLIDARVNLKYRDISVLPSHSQNSLKRAYCSLLVLESDSS